MIRTKTPPSVCLSVCLFSVRAFTLVVVVGMIDTTREDFGLGTALVVASCCLLSEIDFSLVLRLFDFLVAHFVNHLLFFFLGDREIVRVALLES